MTKNQHTNKDEKRTKKRELLVATLLISCVVLIAGWEIVAKLASEPFAELKLKPEAFSGFVPKSTQWSAHLVHTQSTPTEPTVIGYEVRPSFQSSNIDIPKSSIPAPLFIRIVHGYNMVDCMRIKQYKVELVVDTRTQHSADQSPMPNDQCPSPQPPAPSTVPMQVWKITSSIGESSIWVTTMLRSADFAVTSVDTRDMAFPRVGSPDNPSWAPTGLKWSSFRHPIRNARNALRERWNASRCDLWTFLRFRQPAWASDEMLTMVTEYHGAPISDKEETAVIKYTVRAHQFMLSEFQKFWQKSNNNL